MKVRKDMLNKVGLRWDQTLATASIAMKTFQHEEDSDVSLTQWVPLQDFQNIKSTFGEMKIQIEVIRYDKVRQSHALWSSPTQL